jgi:hypothetical protein
MNESRLLGTVRLDHFSDKLINNVSDLQMIESKITEKYNEKSPDGNNTNTIIKITDILRLCDTYYEYLLVYLSDGKIVNKELVSTKPLNLEVLRTSLDKNDVLINLISLN